MRENFNSMVMFGQGTQLINYDTAIHAAKSSHGIDCRLIPPALYVASKRHWLARLVVLPWCNRCVIQEFNMYAILGRLVDTVRERITRGCGKAKLLP